MYEMTFGHKQRRGNFGMTINDSVMYYFASSFIITQDPSSL